MLLKHCFCYNSIITNLWTWSNMFYISGCRVTIIALACAWQLETAISILSIHFWFTLLYLAMRQKKNEHQTFFYNLVFFIKASFSEPFYDNTTTLLVFTVLYSIENTFLMVIWTWATPQEFLCTLILVTDIIGRLINYFYWKCKNENNISDCELTKFSKCKYKEINSTCEDLENGIKVW